MRASSVVISSLSLDPDKGLASSFVEASRRQFGENRLTPLQREPLWKKFLEKFDEPIIKILLAAALLSMFVDLFRSNPLSAGIALGVVAAAAVALYVLGKSQWLPGLMFVSAVGVFF